MKTLEILQFESKQYGKNTKKQNKNIQKLHYPIYHGVTT